MWWEINRQGARSTFIWHFQCAWKVKVVNEMFIDGMIFIGVEVQNYESCSKDKMDAMKKKKPPKKHNQLIPAVCLDLTEQCVFRAWTGTVQCWDIVRGTAYIAHTIYCKRTTWAFHFSSYCSFSAQHCIISADINIKYRYNNNLYPLEELRLTLPNNPAEDEQQNVQV